MTLNDTRDKSLDNIKGFLIILVVFAHILSSIVSLSTKPVVITWAVINAFHMPVFLVISGFLSYGRVVKKQYGKVITRTLIPYLAAQFLLFCMFAATGALNGFFVTTSSDFMSWLRPSGAFWYIFAVFFFIIVTSVLYDKHKTHLHKVLLFSVCFSLLMGFFKPIMYWRLTKLICFFPFFLFGFIAKEKNLKPFFKRNSQAMVALIVGLSLLTIGSFLLYGKVDFVSIVTMEEHGRYNNVVVDSPGYLSFLIGPALRLSMILIALLISMAAISLNINKETFLTHLGRFSLYIYIGHWFIIKGLQVFLTKIPTGYNDAFRLVLIRPYILPVLFIIAILISVFFASKPVRKIMRPFLEPDIDLSSIIDRIKNS